MAAARKKASGETTTCPWCSTVVPVEAATCPSCGASLHEAAEGDVLGVTQVDLGAVSRAGRINVGRLATWLGADKPSDSSELGGRIEPPSEEVRKEMLRLQLAALDAELETQRAQAEAQRELLAGQGAAPTDAGGSSETARDDAAPADAEDEQRG